MIMILKVLLAGAICALVLLSWVSLRYVRQQRRIEETIQTFSLHAKQVEQLPFTVTAVTDRFKQAFSFEDRLIYADAPVLVVVRNARGIAGVVGFYMTEYCLIVTQMQGVKGARFANGEAASYFHDIVDEVATVMKVRKVLILPARKSRWYRDPYRVPREKVPALRARMREIYDTESKKRGYYLRLGRWRKKMT